MDNRRLFIAALLSLAVLVLWQWLFPPAVQEPLVPSAEEAETLEEVESPTTVDEVPAEPAVDAVRAALPPAESIEATDEERIVLESAGGVLELTNRGAQLLSFELRDHADSEGGRVDLLRRRAQSPYVFGLTDESGRGLALNEVLFVVDRSPQGIVFEYAGELGRARKSFSLSREGLLEVEIEVSRPDSWRVYFGPGVRNPSARERKNRFARKSTIWSRSAEVDRLDTAKVDALTRLDGDNLEWIGLQDTYFLAAWIVGTSLAAVDVQPVLEQAEPDGNRYRPVRNVDELGDDEQELPRELALGLEPESDVLSGRAFFGPKQYDALAALPYGLERTVALGAFSVLARPLLWGLRWIHDHVVGNYGWAIILMTVLIRLLLFPLTHKSFVSMQKMQELNPKIQAIRQRYRSKLKDKQGRPVPEMQRKMNEEVMGVYKKEGVNPAGGCLPMLLQIPVLFAFYNLLTAAIELRHASWLGWIKDLSAPDPLYVLPLVMGASQFVQQRMTPTTADPMQRRIFMLMPIFFTVLFLGFPSGLVLYWLTNNLLGIVQQGVYRRLRHPAAGRS